MFDIIELNETGTEEVKSERTVTTPIISLTKISTVVPNAAIVRSTENQRSTTAYPKELPLPVSSAEKSQNKTTIRTSEVQSIKEKFESKDLHREKNFNDLSIKADDKSFSKEVEILSDTQYSLIKLNRTNRKELPQIRELNGDKEHKEDVNKLRLVKEKNVHIDNPSIEANLIDNDKISSTSSSLLTVIKRMEKIEKTSNRNSTSKLASGKQDTEWPEETSTQYNGFLIDPKLENLNLNVPENNESEAFLPLLSKFPERLQQSLEKTKQQPHQLVLGETQIAKTSSHETTEAPQPTTPQKKPNRKRQLTRPQSRSFYPYFFSRVLG